MEGEQDNGARTKMASTPEYPFALSFYWKILAQAPRCVILVYFLGVLSFIYGLWKPLVLSLDFSAYTTADGVAYLHKAARDRAKDASSPPVVYLDFRHLNTTTTTTTTTTTQTQTTTLRTRERSIHIYYEAIDGNILRTDVLDEIRRFEQELQNLHGWMAMCTQSREESQHWCKPGISFVAHLWSTQSNAKGMGQLYTLKLDGNGHQRSVDTILSYLAGADQLSYFFENSLASKGSLILQETIPAMQSRFSFDIVEDGDGFSETDRWRELIRLEVNPFIKRQRSLLVKKNIEISWDASSVLLQIESDEAMQSDGMYVIASLIIVMCYMWLHTRMVAGTCCFVFLIVLSLPMAFVLLPTDEFSLACLFAFFMMLGMGADNVFIFVDFWERSESTGEKLSQRIRWATTHAFSACFVTCLTTSLSFFANLTSGLRPLREFGYFLGMSVVCCLILLSLFVPPFLSMRGELCFRRRRPAAAGKQISPDAFLSSVLPVPAIESGAAEPHPVKRNYKERFIMFVFRKTTKYPRLILGTTVVFLIACLASAPSRVTLDLGRPDPFPVGHNRRNYNNVSRRFRSWGQNMREEVSVCQVDSWKAGDCIFRHCDSTTDVVEVTDKTVPRCWRSKTINSASNATRADWSTQGCSHVTLHGRLAAAAAPNGTEALVELWSSLLQAEAAGDVNSSMLAVAPAAANGLLGVENWSSGNVDFLRLFDVGTVSSSNAIASSQEACEIYSICILGGRTCQLHDWREMNMSSSYPVPLLPDFRRLASSSGSLITVDVSWGVVPLQSALLLGSLRDFYTVDPVFDPDNPWSQRSFLRMCNEISNAFTVASMTCWPKDFQYWLGEYGQRFPSRDFQNHMRVWMSENWWSKTVSIDADRLWFATMSFTAEQDSLPGEYEQKWKDYVDRWNAAAPVGANRAFVSSSTFQQRETETVMISGTLETVIVAAVGAFGSVMVFTCCHLCLSCLVFVMVLAVIVTLFFFMVVVLSWPLGAIELISLIIFVGYAATFCLHIAHAYSDEWDEELEELSEFYSDIPDMKWLEGAWFFLGEDPGQDAADDGIPSSPQAPVSDMMPATPSKPSGRPGSSGIPNDLPPLELMDDDHRYDADHRVDIPCSPGAESKTSSVGSQLSIGSLRRVVRVPTPKELRIWRKGDALARTHRALSHLGGAILSSALSTAASSVALLLCTLTFFPTLGTVLILVTVLSLFAALVLMPAVLVSVRPEPNSYVSIWTRELSKRVSARASALWFSLSTIKWQALLK